RHTRSDRDWSSDVCSSDLVGTLRSLHAETWEALGEIDNIIRPLAPPDVPGSGYVVDCLRSARVAVESGNFEAALKRAVLMGHDKIGRASCRARGQIAGRER